MSLLTRRHGLRAVLDAASVSSGDEDAWARSIIETSAAAIPQALGVGLQRFEFDASLQAQRARHYGVGIIESLSADEALLVARQAPLHLLQKLQSARTPAMMLPPELLSSAIDVDVRSAAVIISQPQPGHALVMVLKLARPHRLTPHEQELFGQLRLSLDAGADALQNDALSGTWSVDARQLEGTLESAELWSGLISGRYRLQSNATGPRRTLSVVENPPHLRAARRLSSRETSVLELSARGVSGKQQSWELQLSTSTVSRLLTSASARLGFVHVNDAIRFFGGLLHRPSLPLTQLTSTERDVLQLVQQGLTNHDIALQRGRSIRTVANQVAAVLRKTGAPSRRALYPVEILEH